MYLLYIYYNTHIIIIYYKCILLCMLLHVYSGNYKIVIYHIVFSNIHMVHHSSPRPLFHTTFASPFLAKPFPTYSLTIVFPTVVLRFNGYFKLNTHSKDSVPKPIHQ